MSVDAYADTERPPPASTPWRVMTSRGQDGRGWDELTASERADLRAAFGGTEMLTHMYWRVER